MLSTGEAIKRKGTADTFTQFFLPDRDLTHREWVALFAALATDERTTRFTINASDPRVFPDDGQKPIMTATDDQKIISRAMFNESYEDPSEWAADVADVDVYRIAGSFDFDGKWTYLAQESDGTLSALFRKDHADILPILEAAEQVATLK